MDEVERSNRTGKSRVGHVLRYIWDEHRVAYVLILFLVVAALTSSTFRSPTNVANVVRQMSVTGIMAVGMTLVITAGGIDLSVGSVAALASVLVMQMQGLPMPVRIAACLAVGVVVGVVNGLLVTFGHAPDFIATLATMEAVRGIALWASGGTIIYGDGTLSAFIGTPAAPIVIFIVISLVGATVLRHTCFGRYLTAVGGQRTVARQTGLPVDRIRVMAYIVSGALAALAGLVTAARTGAGSPDYAKGTELDAIAAVIIGGTSIFGGKGSVVNTFCGMTILQMLLNVFNIWNIPADVQKVAKGVIIACAIILQRKRNTQT